MSIIPCQPCSARRGGGRFCLSEAPSSVLEQRCLPCRARPPAAAPARPTIGLDDRAEPEARPPPASLAPPAPPTELSSSSPGLAAPQAPPPARQSNRTAIARDARRTRPTASLDSLVEPGLYAIVALALVEDSSEMSHEMCPARCRCCCATYRCAHVCRTAPRARARYLTRPSAAPRRRGGAPTARTCRTRCPTTTTRLRYR